MAPSAILGDLGAVSRVVRKGARKVFKYRRKSPWVPTFTGPFQNGRANVGSWLGTKNALHYCAQSANSISWVLFESLYTTAIDSMTACLAHASKKCTQSGNFKFDINSPLQNTVYPKTKDAFPKIQADAGSRLGTKNALHYCAQSANNFSWLLFVSLYTTAIVSPHLPGSFTKLVRTRETFIFYFPNQKQRNYRWVE